MNTLDSRFMRPGNCFAHRFSAPGTFTYALSPIPSSLAAHHGEPPARAVIVTARSGKDPRQHPVTVSMADAVMTASPAELHVTAGDLVVWSADRSLTFGFRVRGTIGDELIDSASLRTESIFTHAFGLPGSYEWADANGSSLHGQVNVVQCRTQRKATRHGWSDLRKGRSCTYEGNGPSPRESPSSSARR